MPLTLVNKCITINGIYCPSFYMNDIIQYFDIYILKYFASAMKLCSCITELAISFSRFKNIKKLNQTNMTSSSHKLYIIILLSVTLAINVIKRLEYGLNHSYFNSEALNFFSRKILTDSSVKTDVSSFTKTSFPYDDLNVFFCLKKDKTLNVSYVVYDIILGSCSISKYILDFYYAFSCLLIPFLIFIIDIYLLIFIKKTNKRKLELLASSENNLNGKKIDEIKSKEKNITKLVVTNTLFLLFLRLPELMSFIYHIKENTRVSKLSYYYDVSKIIQLFDFLFILHPTLQFILFYNYNIYFKESFDLEFPRLGRVLRKTEKL